ncbi:hypothetical protein BJF85_04270 [Saccharomonospora sp. CUA-673]|nr:hypothetical protein BJF85_04270 [Saccharomonospora sp. CUA-673]
MCHTHAEGDRVTISSAPDTVLWAVSGETGTVTEVETDSVTVQFADRPLRMDLPAEVVVPACDLRPGSRINEGTGLRFTSGVPFNTVDIDLRQAKSPALNRHFRALSPQCRSNTREIPRLVAGAMTQ